MTKIKKSMKKTTVVAVSSVLCASVLLGSASIATRTFKAVAHTSNYGVYSRSYDIIGGDDVMPIGVWWAPYIAPYGSYNGNTWPDYVNDYYYDLIDEFGANVVTVSYDNYARGGDNIDSIMTALDLCAERNIGYFVYDSQVKFCDSAEAISKQIANYINHPACIGVHVQDEPTWKQIKTDGYETLYANFKSLNYTDKDLYINMFPEYASSTVRVDESGTTRTYEEFADYFLTTTNQNFYSWDAYIWRDGAANTPQSQKDFFNELATLRKVCNNHGVPMWMFVQAGGGWWSANDDREIHESLFPSEAQTLWNINMGLAYGVKSVQYFTFMQAYEFGFAADDIYNTQLNGLVGAAGNKNPWYYFGQKANKQIEAIDHILMNASNDGIISVGTYPKQTLTSSNMDILASDYRELKSITTSDADDGAVVGVFTYNGKTALYVVNFSTTKKQTITLNFDSSQSFDVIQRAKTVSKTASSVSLKVEAGEGVLVALK